jgi:hypothetical protein
MNIRRLFTIVFSGLCLMSPAQTLYDNFLHPGKEFRPRVWWHWMNGNITQEGIRKDIEWMNRAGIGGFHIFDAGMEIPQVVPHRLVFMTPEWKSALKYAVSLGDSLGMEVAMTSAPGWSNTGGPWVKPEDAMKKLTWRTMTVRGGKKVSISLPEPCKTTGFFQDMAPMDNATTFITGRTQEQWYKDIKVIAVKNSGSQHTRQAKASSSSGKVDMGILTDGSLRECVTIERNAQDERAWVELRYSKPTCIRSLSICDGHVRSEWADAKAPVTRHLLASDDGHDWKAVCDIPLGGSALQTIDITPTTAKRFRVVFDAPKDQNPYAGLSDSSLRDKITPIKLYELSLSTEQRINHAEEKAGFSTPFDLHAYKTIDDGNSQFPSTNDVVDLTPFVHDGKLVWQAPEGTWTVYRFGYALTGKRNHPASPEATGLEVTKLDSNSVKRYIDDYLRLFLNAAGKRQGISHFLIDSYEAGWETWCPDMADEFVSRRGYTLWPWMPVLTGKIIESPTKSEQFLFDWRKTIGELISENLYGFIHRYCRRLGLTTYFESHENGRLYLADGMDVKSQADIPMAAAWCPTRSNSGSTVSMAESDIRESASVAHLYGKAYCAGESLTANGLMETAYKFYPGNLKPVADMMMANGQTRFVIHESSHQPVDSLKPGVGMMIFGQWFNRNETWAHRAKAWTDYLSRSCYLLAQGKPVADVCYYYGEDNNVTSLFGVNSPDIPHTYNFDYINPSALIHLLQWDGHSYVVPNGMTYRLLVIDNSVQAMSLPILRKIKNLADAGAPILGNRPAFEPTMMGNKSEFNRLADDIWRKGRPNVLTGMTVAEALRNLDVWPDFSGGDSLRFVHRQVNDSTEI